MNKDAIIKLVNEQMWAKTDADVPSFKEIGRAHV